MTKGAGYLQTVQGFLRGAKRAALLLTGGDVQGQSPAVLVQELRIIDNHLKSKKKSTTGNLQPSLPSSSSLVFRLSSAFHS